MKKSTIAILSAFIGGIIGAVAIGLKLIKFFGKEVKSSQELSEKHLGLMRLLNQWLLTKQEGKKLEDYLKKNEIKTVAIYGMSYVGNRVFDELKGTDVEVKYVIDRNGEACYAEVDVFLPEEELPEVDAVLVTAIYYFDEIEKMLSEKLSCPILSLEDVLYEI